MSDDTAPERTELVPHDPQSLAVDVFDVLVVGGGITGAGVARDAVMRGLRVGLVEQSDFGSGTSSRSSKLVHGGLRYLENFEFRLVFEALRERAVQRRLQPNLVWRQSFVFPVYKGASNGLFRVSIGLWLYDLLSLFRGNGWHRRLGRKGAVTHLKGLRREGLQGAVLYFDCRTDDARLTLANVLDAGRHGAWVQNYTRFDGAVFHEGRVVGARVTDAHTGESRDIGCRHIVYATGPWTDEVPEAPGEGRLLRPTKGVHVVIPSARLRLDHAVVVSGVSDGRVVFLIPFGNTTFVGTTDTDYSGPKDEVRANAEDVAYLLDTANHYFPGLRLVASDVQSTWAGLRPLIRSSEEAAYRTSREHQLYADPRGITTVAGGKLTTYRSMAEEVVDAVIEDLRSGGQIGYKPCRTHRVPLDPDLPKASALDPSDETQRMLWRHHGSGMNWILERMKSHPPEAERLCESLLYILAQVTYAVRFERATQVADVLIRRLQVFYRAPDQGLGCAHNVASHMAGLLEQGPDWVVSQVRCYEDQVTRSRIGSRALSASPSSREMALVEAPALGHDAGPVRPS